MTFCKTDIVVFARLLISQPSTVLGKAGGIGRGWPKATQNKNASAVRAPVIAPPSVANSVPMPSVKIPNKGPPTTPKIVKPACDKKFLLFAQIFTKIIRYLFRRLIEREERCYIYKLNRSL